MVNLALGSDEEPLFPLEQVDCLFFGQVWHRINIGTLQVVEDSEGGFWFTATMAAYASSSNTPSILWAPVYEISGYRLQPDASTD